MSNQFAQYFALREKRLQLQREADALEQQEKDILYELTKGLTDTKVVRSDGGYRMTADRKMTATVRDWAAVLDYIRATGQVDLLQKRLTESAVKSRWDADVIIPGVEPGFKYAVTIVKE